MMATNTWNIIIPKKASLPHTPWLSTHARNCSGWDTNSSMGLPTNQNMETAIAIARPKPISATACFRFFSRFSIYRTFLIGVFKFLV